VLVALAVSLGVQTSYANPMAVSAELRAVSCCARHCDGPVSVPSSRTCCGVTGLVSGPAEVPRAQMPGPITPLVLLPATVLPTPARPDRGMLHVVQPRGSGPPTFLEQRHLLL
jgi:hypothetical protein